jgi:NAD(P)-dependent dehydrogenase (short-subunit alcohol dehydrogenase family)
MKELRQRVAVVTGAASGIGRAMADRFAAEGMRVVLADVEQQALNAAAKEIAATGAEVFAVRTDVSDAAQVDALARQAFDRFGAVHILCNNAGVVGYKPSWELSLEDWRWVLGVNLMGVIHGVRAFVPIMLKQGDECHIVNTSSIAGLLANSGSAPYDVSKFGVVALSETLYHELAMASDGRIGVSVLCPGLVKTQILEADRNRPAGPLEQADMPTGLTRDVMRQVMALGISAEQVAGNVLDAIRERRFYILPHPEFKAQVAQRAETIVAGDAPAARGLPAASEVS